MTRATRGAGSVAVARRAEFIGTPNWSVGEPASRRKFVPACCFVDTYLPRRPGRISQVPLQSDVPNLESEIHGQEWEALVKPQKPTGSGDLGRSAFPRLAGRRRYIHLRDRDRRREAQLAGPQDGLRNAAGHDHGVNFLCVVWGQRYAGRPAFYDVFGVSLPEHV